MTDHVEPEFETRVSCPDCGFIGKVYTTEQWLDLVNGHECETDSNDSEPETIGELVGDGVTADDIAETERVLHRFVSAAEDAYGEHVPGWLRTAHAVTGRVAQHYQARLETTETND